jgi:hypothetical protein
LALERLKERDAAIKAIHWAVKTADLCKRVMWMAFSFLLAGHSVDLYG